MSAFFNTNTLKNFIIIILVALAVSLTGKLWFENISGHSFFYTFLPRLADIAAADGTGDRNHSIPAGIPASSQASLSMFSSQGLTVQNPYMAGGGLLKDNIKKLVAPFFPDAASQRDSISNGVFTYSTDEVIVKYRPGVKYDVLEYYDYRLPDRRVSTTAYDDYNAAKGFIAADKLVVNNCYLDSYQFSNGQVGTVNTFYFDYFLDNAPLLVDDSVAKETGMEHAIEVTVESGQVISYKKLVYTFGLEGNGGS